ncbi:MAG: ribbon-helix-helix domain-containing protein [Cuniculiplasma sp.]|jgi:metal-responsive CopG/Arc/MetJ family transcriptional regulator
MYSNKEGNKMYDTVKIPHSLTLEVERVVKESSMGYRNRSEFIIEAVREKIAMFDSKEVKA